MGSVFYSGTRREYDKLVVSIKVFLLVYLYDRHKLKNRRKIRKIVKMYT